MPFLPRKIRHSFSKIPIFYSGILPSTLHPVKSPSQTNTLTDEFPHTHPRFKANLPSLFMTPTTYKFRQRDRIFDHYGSRNLEQLSF